MPLAGKRQAPRALKSATPRPISEAMTGGTRREVPMAIVLDHTIVPAHDKEASARFLARILGLRYGRCALALRAVAGQRHADAGFRQRHEFREPPLRLQSR